MKRAWLYRSGVFLGGFLMFQIELMLSKALLPEFGGSYLVWTSSVMFFQAMLLAGYLYIHGVQQRFGIVRYARWHCGIFILAFAAFCLRFDQVSGALRGLPLAVAVPLYLLSTIGVPFFLLSCVSIVLQSWFYTSNLPEKENPYFLYSSSNFGSMAGLITYPLVCEPFLTLRQQWYMWWVLYAVLAILMIGCLPSRSSAELSRGKSVRENRQAPVPWLAWFMLSLAGSFSLLAITNIVTFDIASVALLWALFLGVYLATFILAFKRRQWYPGWMKTLLGWILPLGIVLYLASLLRIGFPVMLLVFLQLAIQFVLCMNCHGRLAQMKPPGGILTTYYLVIALGGFVGSVIVGALIPRINTFFIEYPMSFLLVLCALFISNLRQKGTGIAEDMPYAVFCGLAVVLLFTAMPWAAQHFFPVPQKMLFLVIGFVLVLLLRIMKNAFLPVLSVLLAVIVCGGWLEEFSCGAEHAQRLRNYYGIYLVFDAQGARHFKHGTTLHGKQYLGPEKCKLPLSYYHQSTPIGQLLSNKSLGFNQIGMVGLGAGAVASYLDSRQSLTVYELDPDCLMLARRYFSYLRDAQAKGAHLSYLIGDGRLSLRHAKDGSLDLLIIDAFNSDSIPVHLMTQDAIREYLRVVKKDGLLLVNISSRIFDLAPVLFSEARAEGLYSCFQSNEEFVHPDADVTRWIAMSKEKRIYDVLVDTYKWITAQSYPKKIPAPWTDQYSNLLSALR